MNKQFAWFMVALFMIATFAGVLVVEDQHFKKHLTFHKVIARFCVWGMMICDALLGILIYLA